MKRKAFTFVEAIVVVVILAILAAIIYPNLHRGTPIPNRQRSQCMSNLKQIALGTLQYTQDYDEKLPPTTNAKGGWADLVFSYVRLP